MNSGFFSRLRTASRGAILGFTCLVISFPAALWAQQGFATLEEQMTGEEFRATGLDKLSPEELATLNEWIRARSLATLDAPRSATSPSLTGNSNRSEIEEMPRETIVSRINGTFSGWDGQTVFKLENGMIWAQADKDKFYTQEMQSPTVTIKPGLFGAWNLTVEGHDDECRVQRIQ